MSFLHRVINQVYFAFVVVLLVSALAACDSNSATESDNLPANHTVSNGGALHKPGYSTPFEASSGCTTCHGADLRGGTATINGVDVSTPSCFSCHGRKW
jgi:hypothetical protein